MLDAPESNVRAAAAAALANVGSGAKKALGRLRAALDDKEGNVRVFAAQAVYSVTGDATLAVPVLIRCLSEPDKAVKVKSCVALGSMAEAALKVDRKVIAAVEVLTKDKDDDVKQAAVDAMKKLDPKRK
jgi:HEAT repeat protein